jgi:flagella basal body P-ring formation protein FlgA
MSLVATVILVLGASIVPRAEFENVVERFILDRYMSTPTAATVEFRSVPDDISVRGHDYVLRVSESTAATLSGNVSLPVEVVADGRQEYVCMVSVRVRTFDTVLVAGRQLGKHQRIELSDVRRVRIETTGLRGMALRSEEALAGLRCARIITAGSVLTEDIVEPVPDVLQGSTVKLVVKGKNFTFSSNAIAGEDGMKGEQIIVRRVGSPGRLQARVVDRSTVEVPVP